MKTISRITLTSIAFVLALIYALPNLAIMFGIALAVYSEYVSLFFCIIFAYNIARMVESAYGKFRKNGDATEDSKTNWVHGRGFSYLVEDDKVTFTFRDIQNSDGRQVSRLKFMREKFFKNED